MKKKPMYLNTIDVLLICISIIVVVVFYSTFLYGNNLVDFSEKSNVVFNITVEKLPSEFSGLIKNGDKIYFSNKSNDSFGFINSALYSRSTLIGDASENQYADIRFYPDLHDLTISVECEIPSNNNQLILDGKSIGNGDNISFFSSNFSGSGVISDIEVVS